MHAAIAPRRLLDLRVLGARALPARELVRLVCGPRVADDDVDDATAALDLAPAARDAVLLGSPCGPRLLAALELGRRTSHGGSPAQARVAGPADVVAAIATRIDEERCAVVGLDVRLRVARLQVLDAAPIDDVVVTALQQTLAAGCRRLVLVRRTAGPAAPGDADVAAFAALRARADLVGVAALDSVVLGDDGWCSLLRLGAAPPRDPRYR